MLITENIEQKVGERRIVWIDAVQQCDFAAPALFPVLDAAPVLDFPIFAVAPNAGGNPSPQGVHPGEDSLFDCYRSLRPPLRWGDGASLSAGPR